jgi:hypothetical protein
MSFIAKHIIGPDERLVGIARAHWIYVVIGTFWALVVLVVGGILRDFVMQYGLPNTLFNSVYILGYHLGPGSWWLTGIFAATAFGLFLVFLIQYLSIEVGLSTRRVIRKSGLIAVEVQEIEIEEIDAARISHGWLGALFGYGAIFLDCRFVGDVRLPTIRRPYQFLRALHKVQSQNKHPSTPVSTKDLSGV